MIFWVSISVKSKYGSDQVPILRGWRETEKLAFLVFLQIKYMFHKSEAGSLESAC